MLHQPPVWFVAIAFLAALGPLIIGHELGHYWVGRWFGVGAEAFSIGFGKEIAVPSYISDLADEKVGWDERALVDAIRRQGRHEESTRWDTIEFKLD